MGVGYHETRASNWGLETEIYQLEPYTYRVCVFVSVCVSARNRMLTQTHMEKASECCIGGIGLQFVETVYVCLNII